MNDEDAVLARKQTDGENEDDSGAGMLSLRFCHRYDTDGTIQTVKQKQ